MPEHGGITLRKYAIHSVDDDTAMVAAQRATSGKSHRSYLSEALLVVARLKPLLTSMVRDVPLRVHLRKEKKRKEKKRKEKKRKEKTTPFGVNSMRSQVLYRAAQTHLRQYKQSYNLWTSVPSELLW